MAARPGRTRTGNLPRDFHTFVGRRRELDQLRRLLDGTHLVTLTGPGGVGKTRLALEAAARLTAAFPDGAWFVDLGEVRTGGFVAAAIEQALGVRGESLGARGQSLEEYLAARQLLLVLDNCEHVVDEAASVTAELLRTCAHLRVLATSRERLGIAGEALLPLRPLGTRLGPDSDAPADRWSEAVELFRDRAQLVDPEFRLTPGNSPAVERIVRQVEGLPLAIELAAARLRTLSAEELAERLQDQLRLLTEGMRAGPARHYTMRDCVLWSYDQCSPAEQLLWQRLGVFAGGFELDAVEGVCGFGDLSRDDVLDLLGALVDKSVVLRVDRGERARYRLLEPVRDFARECLEAGGEAALVQERHRDWFLAMACEIRHGEIGPEQPALWRRLDRELPDLRLAFDELLADPACVGERVRMAAAVGRWMTSRRLLGEARRWLAAALEKDADVHNYDRLCCLYRGALLAAGQGDDDVARAYVERARIIARDRDEPLAHAHALHAEGVTCLFGSDVPGALRALTRAFHMYAECDRPGWLGTCATLLVVAAGLAGDGRLAESVFQQALAAMEGHGEVHLRSHLLWSHGMGVRRAGDTERATKLLTDSVHLTVEVDDLMGGVWCLQGLAFAACDAGAPDRAATLLGAASALSHDVGFKLTAGLAGTDYEQVETSVRTALGQRRFREAFERGRQLSLEEAVAFATSTDATPVRRSTRPAVNGTGPDPAGPLTAREREVAELIAEGLTNPQIAERLVVSQRTVRGHVENILLKLGFRSRSQVAAWMAAASRH